MTAGNVILVMLGKMVVSGVMFMVVFSFGLWLGRIGFIERGVE